MNTKGNKPLGLQPLCSVYHVACVVAFIKYYAHTNGATKFCNGLLECGWWCCGSNVVGGVVARMWLVVLWLECGSWFASDHV